MFLAGLWFLFPTFLPALHGATATWVGGSGDWNTAANWSTGSLPGTNDNVVIGAGASITVTHSSGTHTVQSVQSQQAFVLSGGSLTVSNTVQVNNAFTLSGGTLVNATVLQGTNSASIIISGGTLDGVTVSGNWDVGASINVASLTVLDGLTINGTLQVGNPTNSWYGYVSFAGSQTLGGNGTVVFGNAGTCAGLPVDHLAVANAGTTLTIGSGITVHGQNGTIGYPGGCFGGPQNVSVVNQGVISCDVSGGTIVVNAQPLVNNGTVAMSNGGSLSFNYVPNLAGVVISGDGTLTLNGTWQNTGPLSAVSLNLSGSWTNSGTINASTLSLSGSWTNTGAMSVTNGTLTLNGNWLNSGTLNATNATVNLGGAFTLGTLGVFNRSGGTVNLTATLTNTGTTLALNAATGP